MEKNQELYLLLCQRMRKEIKLKEQVILKLHHELEAAKKQIVEFNGTRKNYFESSNQSQNNVKDKIKQQIIIMNDKISKCGIVVKKVDVCLIDEDDLENKNIQCLFHNSKSIENDQLSSDCMSHSSKRKKLFTERQNIDF
jgi:hypothetical protein